MKGPGLQLVVFDDADLLEDFVFFQQVRKRQKIMRIHRQGELAAGLGEHFRRCLYALKKNAGYFGEDCTEKILRDTTHMVCDDIGVALHGVARKSGDLRFDLAKICERGVQFLTRGVNALLIADRATVFLRSFNCRDDFFRRWAGFDRLGWRRRGNWMALRQRV